MADQHSNDPRPGTDDAEYAQRLVRLQTRSWKTKLDVQRVYRWNIGRMDLGRTVEVGCGIGRMLKGLPAGSVGVDHNPYSIEVAREFGYTAYTVDEWDASELASSAAFDGMLLAHVVEHMTEDEVATVIEHYLPAMKPGGKVAFVVPQEVGYRSDETHVRFIDVPELTALCTRLGLTPQKSWSYPFPRPVGKAFIYNETCMVARVPA